MATELTVGVVVLGLNTANLPDMYESHSNQLATVVPIGTTVPGLVVIAICSG